MSGNESPLFCHYFDFEKRQIIFVSFVPIIFTSNLEEDFVS